MSRNKQEKRTGRNIFLLQDECTQSCYCRNQTYIHEFNGDARDLRLAGGSRERAGLRDNWRVGGGQVVSRGVLQLSSRGR